MNVKPTPDADLGEGRRNARADNSRYCEQRYIDGAVNYTYQRPLPAPFDTPNETVPVASAAYAGASRPRYLPNQHRGRVAMVVGEYEENTSASRRSPLRSSANYDHLNVNSAQDGSGQGFMYHSSHASRRRPINPNEAIAGSGPDSSLRGGYEDGTSALPMSQDSHESTLDVAWPWQVNEDTLAHAGTHYDPHYADANDNLPGQCYCARIHAASARSLDRTGGSCDVCFTAALQREAARLEATVRMPRKDRC